MIKKILYGFIDKKGKWIIEPRFDNVMAFSDGVAATEVDDKWGYIDKTGKWIIEPHFDLVWNFTDGMAKVAVDGKYGYIDKNGKWVDETQFEAGEDVAEDIADGIAAVKVDGKWGYVDRTGAYVIEPLFDYAGDFHGGIAAAGVTVEIAEVEDDIDPERFIVIVRDAGKAAKKATVELMKSHGDRCFIEVYGCELKVYTDSGYKTSFDAVGLNEKGRRLVFGQLMEDGQIYWNDRLALAWSSYPELYAFVARKIKGAHTREKVERILEERKEISEEIKRVLQKFQNNRHNNHHKPVNDFINLKDPQSE